jgi:hypothetical protein
MVARLLITCAVLGACSKAMAENARATVLSLVLPTRSERGQQVAVEAEQLGDRLASAWHLARAARTAGIDDLAPRLARAEALALQGNIDQAASIYDAALEDGARALDRVRDRPAFVAAHVARSAIALSRGEAERARFLLARVLRWDPTFELALDERSPQMQALKASVAAAGPGSLAESDWQGPCRAAEVLFLARPSASGLEVARFDRCQPTGTVRAQSVAEVEAQLAGLPPPKERSPVRGLDRTKVTLGVLGLGLGLALAAAGTFYAVQAGREHGDLSSGCSAMMPCPGEQLLARGDEYHRSVTLASVLGAVGGAALIAGAVVTALGFRHPKPERVTLSSGGHLELAF